MNRPYTCGRGRWRRVSGRRRIRHHTPARRTGRPWRSSSKEVRGTGVVQVAIRSTEITDTSAVGKVHLRAWQAAYRGVMPDEHLDGHGQRSAPQSYRSLTVRGSERSPTTLPAIDPMPRRRNPTDEAHPPAALAASPISRRGAPSGAGSGCPCRTGSCGSSPMPPRSVWDDPREPHRSSPSPRTRTRRRPLRRLRSGLQPSR